MDDPELARRLGERVRGLRKARGLTLKEVASLSGLTLSRLGYVETGERELTVGALVRLARALGVGVNDLVGEPSPNDAVTSIVDRLPEDPIEVRRRVLGALRALDGA